MVLQDDLTLHSMSNGEILQAECDSKDSRKIQPFQRKRSNDESGKRFVDEIFLIRKLLSNNDNDEIFDEELDSGVSETLIQSSSDVFAKRWKLKDEMSEIAFRGLLLVLEHCLSYELKDQYSFAFFIEALGFHTVFFWKKAVQYLFDSDMQFGTNYRDALLFSLTLYDVNMGRNRLRELFAAVPGLQNSLLAKSAKRFEEAHHTMVQRRGSSASSLLSSKPSSSSSDAGNKLLDEVSFDIDDVDSEVAAVMGNNDVTDDDYELTLTAHPEPRRNTFSVNTNAENHTSKRRFSISSASNKDELLKSINSPDHPDTVLTGGLTSGHFQERVINISNAPPVSFKRGKDSGLWEIGQGSGGLVSCCDPVMSKDPSNMWLACFGPEIRFDRVMTPVSTTDSPMPTLTNSLGLPIIRPMTSEVYLSMLQDPRTKEEDEINEEIKVQMSLLGVLRTYNKDNYKLNPVLIPDNDYNTYYGGISNGLLWPALHNLSEFIVKDYDDPAVVRDHWNAYVRVNYQFALNAVRTSRAQDFLWIHDYHLLLTGMIIQSLDTNLEVGFFLHIPFQPPDEFFTKFKVVAEPVLRGLLRFTKIGFQTDRDRKTFIEIVQNQFTSAHVQYHKKIDKHTITFEGYTSSLGVFPVSIKTEDFLKIAKNECVQQNANKLKEKLMPAHRDGKIFFSVERFDYTKGIKEKLNAYVSYFKRHPDRIGKDVFVQVAVTNRRTVDTYRKYQDDCEVLVQNLNEQFKCRTDPSWKALIFQTEGLNRSALVTYYLAMDIGVVTPRKDGMNLVAKEMLICNPKAALVLSCGAGTEQQFSIAGFYNDFDKCYYRIADIYDADSFADTLYEAATEDRTSVEVHSSKLNEYLMDNDIEKWSESFLDPSWTHYVIQQSDVKSLKSFNNIMFQTRNVRRQIVQRVLEGQPIKPHFGISLKNAELSLKQSCQPDSNILMLTATDYVDDSYKISANFDITHELVQLEIDDAFLNYIQSDDYYNLEKFFQNISKYHPDGIDEFNREIDDVIQLICAGDHFKYFFTDRDGTLSAYACSYASSIQGAYSGVIQSIFAQRCTQYAAIITQSPMQNIGIMDVTVIPDGYYCYGASCGREWYVSGSRRFKDDTITDEDLQLLENLADKIAALLENPMYVHFAWIGSGFQRHYGHLTVARQDVYKSVDENLSNVWYGLICDLVQEFDPTGKSLHVHETETDIKIYLRAKLSGKVFTKGHGLRLFAENMNLQLDSGNILVCADSDTDLPMLKEVLMINPNNVYSVWVTKSEDLKQKVIDLCESVKNSNYAFPSSPLVLLGAMAQATIREIKIRPSNATTNALQFDD